ncbi:DinB family protein [Candidatus Woesebacteria bacterium]|nr:DinB family protein [Candidatus Woesebacteria bacterium]
MHKNIAVSCLHDDLLNAHTNFLQTMEGVTNEVSAFNPTGTANPIAGTFAHLVFSEDFFTQGFLKKEKPLFETEWKDKTGISELQPTEWVTAYPAWLKSVTVDMPQALEYTKAVFAATEAFVAGLVDADLEKSVDMSMFGMGEKKVGNFIGSMITGHANNIMGEISVLKGIQGLKGYPF